MSETVSETGRLAQPREHDMTVVLTGATSGIGQAAARLLAPHATQLILHGPQRPQEVIQQLEELRASSAGEVHYVQADFDSLAMVRALASEISKITDRLDVLINNAGRPGAPRRRLSQDGNEATLQTNYLAAVLLTELLTPVAPRIRRPSSPCRFVDTSFRFARPGRPQSRALRLQRHDGVRTLEAGLGGARSLAG
ncbi:SDR family NAD(P)-dependent oxidoreductase [Streptomyces sp. NPDC127197]|uniref:SDR family NAD(P)-dependent oxidoreductase n=1 Tax=Streptomyces sp. NPDC127197 TaxID=3345388 RepID=UPI0036261C70